MWQTLSYVTKAYVESIRDTQTFHKPKRIRFSWFNEMGGKGKKKRNSKDSTASKEKKKGGKKKNGRASGGGGGGGASSSAKSSKIQGDIFSEGAMENAYLICHNVQVP